MGRAGPVLAPSLREPEEGRVWDPPLHTVGRDVGGKCARPELAGDAPSSVWPSASHLPPEGEGCGRSGRAGDAAPYLP